MADTTGGRNAWLKYDLQTSAGSISSFLMTAPAAVWLGDVQRRLFASIGVDENEHSWNGAWLSKEVANNASNFFVVTSAYFPREPYLYGSKDGDLIAEFGDEKKTMTIIIKKDHCIAFGAVGEKTVQKTVSLKPIKSEDLRQQISDFTNRFQTAAHAAVAAKP